MANTSLTDTLNDPNYIPQVIGGAGGGNLIGGAAEFGSNFLDNLAANDRRAAAARNVKDDTAVNEAAAGAFKILTSGDMGEEGEKALTQAERFQKAFKNGSMGDTKYDLAMKNWYADVINRHPGKANDILQEGAARGFDHFYFREAKMEQDAAAATVTRRITADNKALEFAQTMGQYNSATMTVAEGIKYGYDLMNREAERKFLADQRDQVVKMEGIAGPERDRRLAEIGDQLGQNMSRSAFESIDVTMQGTIYPLVRSGGDDPVRQKALYGVLDSGIVQLNAMRSNLIREANNMSRTVEYADPMDPTGKTMVTRSVPVPQKAIDAVTKEIDTQIEVLKWLQTAPNEKIKSYIEATTLNDKLSAQEYIPNIQRMANQWGMTTAGILETLHTTPGTFGLTPSEAQPLIEEFAASAKQFSEKSVEFMHAMTAKGQSPAFSKDPKEATLGYMYNARMASTMGETLLTGNLTTEQDRKAAVKNFEDNASSLLVATAQTYVPANISRANAKTALNMLFNDRTTQYLDAYVKNGGDASLATMMGTQRGIIAGTFVEALLSGNQETIKYNKLTGKAEVINPGWRGASVLGIPGLAAPANKPDPATQDTVQTINGILDFIDKNNAAYPILKPEHLKESGRTIRDVAAGEGFQAYAKSVMASINEQEKIKAQEQEYFDKAVTSFQSGGGFDTNPFDNLSNAGAIETGSALEFIRGQEGTALVEDDNGRGRAKFGILESTLKNSKYSDIPLTELTQKQADEIYTEEYIQPVIDAGVPPEAQLAVIDAAVNQGLNAALKMWDLADQNLDEFVKKRLARYRKTKGYETYGPVWEKRTLESAGMTNAQ